MAMTGTKKLHLKNRLSNLAVMVKHDLLTDPELAVFIEEALDAIRYAVRQPYDIEWGGCPFITKLDGSLLAWDVK